MPPVSRDAPAAPPLAPVTAADWRALAAEGARPAHAAAFVPVLDALVARAAAGRARAGQGAHRAHAGRLAVVHAELRQRFAGACPPAPVHGVQRESFVAGLRRARVLRPEGRVFFAVQGMHGVVSAEANARQRDGRPYLGKLYSTFLFDVYRRPYKFGGDAAAVARTWREAFAALRVDLQAEYEERAAAAERLAAAAGSAAGPAAAACATNLVGQVQEEVAGLREEVRLARQQEPLIAACLAAALPGLRGVTYPNIDLFLRALASRVSGLMEARRVPLDPGDSALQQARGVVFLAFGALAKANRAKKMQGREVWPQFCWTDSWRTRADQRVALMLTGAVHAHNLNAYQFLDVLPCERRVVGDARPKQVPWVPNLMRRTEEPVSHAALRAAYGQFALGAAYFDERLQRNIAVSEDDVAAKPPRSAAAVAAHDARVRAAALAALSTPLPASTPPSFLQARARQRAAVARQVHFPTFACVPWRVDAAEAAWLGAHKLTMYRSLPYGRGARAANCNGIAIALLRTAAELEAREHGMPVAPHIRGTRWWRAVGSGHRVTLPRPRVR